MRNELEKIKVNQILTRISTLMFENKISQSHLQNEIDVTQSVISSWFTKGICPNVIYLNRIAEFFNVSLDYLVNGV